MTAIRRPGWREVSEGQWVQGSWAISYWPHPCGAVWIVWDDGRQARLTDTLRQAKNWIAKQDEGSGSR